MGFELSELRKVLQYALPKRYAVEIEDFRISPTERYKY